MDYEKNRGQMSEVKSDVLVCVLVLYDDRAQLL